MGFLRALDPRNPWSGLLLLELTISADKYSGVSIIRHPNKQEESSELGAPALCTYTRVCLSQQSPLC